MQRRKRNNDTEETRVPWDRNEDNRDRRPYRHRRCFSEQELLLPFSNGSRCQRKNLQTSRNFELDPDIAFRAIDILGASVAKINKKFKKKYNIYIYNSKAHLSSPNVFFHAQVIFELGYFSGSNHIDVFYLILPRICSRIGENVGGVICFLAPTGTQVDIFSLSDFAKDLNPEKRSEIDDLYL